MRSALLLAALAAVVALSSAKTFFSETFDSKWEDRWVVSTFKGDDAGEWKHSAGKFYKDAEADKGIQTGQDARFYQISAKFPEFSNEGSDLVFQFRIKHEQNIDCGGGYVKLLPAGFEQAKFNGDSPYFVMFGPDICGSSTKKTHVILTKDDKNHLISKEVRAESDELSHLYTLILRPDNTYEVRIDGKEVQKGSIKEDWNILAAKEIPDPAASKPVDWVDDAEMDDPTDVKPAGYDDIPAQIADPEAVKDAEWDEEIDGVFEAPLIDNPDYQGPWSAKKIPNPAYKGVWVHPMIANPDFKDDDTLYSFSKIGGVGIEIWQVKAGTIFDDIIVTDSLTEAETFASGFEALHAAEKAALEKEQEETRKRDEEERKKREEEEKAKASEKEEEKALGEDEEEEHDDHEGHDHAKDEL